ncbi:MAG: hypothetical protein RLZZ46_657 [Bacteroidota bacterium]|jgi:hypothetical protein
MKIKHYLSFVAVSALMIFVACGPSAEEKAAKEKAAQDSMDAAMATEMEKEAEAAAEMHDSLSTAGKDTAAAEAAGHAEEHH